MDITLDLQNGTYRPYKKPGDRPLYVHALSNHPPQIIKNIPASIEKRLVQNSATEDIFNNAKTEYQEELNRCGYSYELAYNEPNIVGNIKKKRKPRKVTWFNPPWSLNVGTNVAQEFLALLDKHFPPSHKLHSLMNRSNIKVSYRCLPNMGSVVSKHNNKVMKNSAKQTDRKEAECNCKPSFKNSCPMPGKCNQDGVVYQTTITSDGGISKKLQKEVRDS